MITMNKKPYVSVVMTSYNREKYINQAIDSILAQECRFPIEIIIGDDCSSDGTRDILRAYKEKHPDIFVLNFQTVNQGVGANWASSVKLARGKYIAFLDDDDYWCDNRRLQEMADYMDGHDECGLIHTAYYAFDAQTGKKVLTINHFPENVKGIDRIEYIFKHGMPNLFSTSMIRKSVIDQYVDLDAYIQLKFGLQDWPTVLLIAPYCEFAWLEKPSVMYRLTGNTISSPLTYEAVVRKYAREESMQKYVCERYPEKLHYSKEDWEKYVNMRLLSVAYRRGEYRKAKEYSNHSYPHGVQYLCARTWISFHAFRLAQWLKMRKRDLIKCSGIQK